MPLDQQTAAVSLAVSILIVVVAALLVVWQWYERRHRATELSEADASHFARQEVRRWLVTVILILLAVGVTLGSRIELKVAGPTNLLFFQVWLGVILLIFVLLCLAMLDWVSTRLYARRHRRTIVRARWAMIRALLRPQSHRGKGPGGPSDSVKGPPPA
jgi:hypothetical protein